MLRDSGVVSVENGEIIHHISKDSESVPRTLNKVIINRVDRLDTISKLILRVASVIGTLEMKKEEKERRMKRITFVQDEAFCGVD